MYLHFFSKTYRNVIAIVLLIRCNHIMLKGFVMKIFEIKFSMNGSESNCFYLACIVQLLVCSRLADSAEG